MSTETVISPATSGAPVLLRNEGNDNNWCKVNLRGTVSNRDGIGARLTFGAQGMIAARDLNAGTSFVSMNSRTLTFGLGDAEAAEFIEVRWPSGIEETFPGPLAGETVTLVEGSTCTADFDGDLQVSVGDLLVVILGWGPCEGSCPPCPGDLNGDCTVDVLDLVGIVQAWGPCFP